jgi:hypothetical protein
MSELDNFPLEPDYSIVREHEVGVANLVSEDKSLVHVFTAPARRRFSLQFTKRLKAEFDSILSFRNSHLGDFFTYHDTTLGRKFSVYFDEEPVYRETASCRYTIDVEFLEAVNKALAEYPSFSYGHPFGTILTADAIDLGGSGKLFFYSGYGLRVQGSYTAIFIDEAATDNSSVQLVVPLGLHRVRITGGPPTSVDYLV